MSLELVDLYFSILGGLLLGAAAVFVYPIIRSRELFWPLFGVWVFYFFLQRSDDIVTLQSEQIDHFLGTSARWWVFALSAIAGSAIVIRLQNRKARRERDGL